MITKKEMTVAPSEIVKKVADTFRKHDWYHYKEFNVIDTETDSRKKQIIFVYLNQEKHKKTEQVTLHFPTEEFILSLQDWRIWIEIKRTINLK